MSTIPGHWSPPEGATPHPHQAPAVVVALTPEGPLYAVPSVLPTQAAASQRSGPIAGTWSPAEVEAPPASSAAPSAAPPLAPRTPSTGALLEGGLPATVEAEPPAEPPAVKPWTRYGRALASGVVRVQTADGVVERTYALGRNPMEDGAFLLTVQDLAGAVLGHASTLNLVDEEEALAWARKLVAAGYVGGSRACDTPGRACLVDARLKPDGLVLQPGTDGLADVIASGPGEFAVEGYRASPFLSVVVRGTSRVNEVQLLVHALEAEGESTGTRRGEVVVYTTSGWLPLRVDVPPHATTLPEVGGEGG